MAFHVTKLTVFLSRVLMLERQLLVGITEVGKAAGCP